MACTGKVRKAHKISVEKLKERDYLEDVGVDGSVQFRCVLQK
jgi:hypothetical protein